MKMLKIFIYIYFLFVLEHVVHSRSTGIDQRNQLSENAHYKNLYHDVDEDDETKRKLIQNNQEYDDVADNNEFNESLYEKNYNDSPNEVSEDSIDEDDNSLNDDSESKSEALLNEELMKLSLDSFKALKEAVYEIDDKIEDNQKAKRETQSTKRKFQEEEEDDDGDDEVELEEKYDSIHRDNKRHDGCHCNKNCASKNEDEGIIEKKIHAKINKLKDSSKMDKKRFLGYSKQSLRRNKRSASTITSPSGSKQEMNKEGLDKVREQYLESFPKDEGNMASITTFRKSNQFLQRVKRDN